MNYSTHYNLNLAEGTDLVNPLTVDVPNYQTIDNTMYTNEQAGVGTATELKSGTIHAITRANTNRNVFHFKSTSVFNTGDTFTVDGGNVTASYPDGSSLKDRCFIVGSDVLCLLDGAQLTVLTTFIQSATEVPFDDSSVIYSATNAQSAIEHASTATGTEYDNGTSTKAVVDAIKAVTDKFDISGALVSVEFGIFNVTYSGQVAPVTGVRIEQSNGRYTIFGTVLGGSYWGNSFLIYSSWSDSTIRVAPN